MQNLFNVSGKVAVVTGGSRGIGAMIAEGFVANGVKTYITARKAEELEATAERLSAQGECIAIPSDLSTLSGITAFAAALREREPAVHILVNNAGATWGAAIDEFPESGWDKVMDLNVKSIFFLTQQMLPLLRAGRRDDDPARVINIGSVNGITNAHGNNYGYSASKAAVHHLTRQLGADLAKEGINVNAIAPGLFPSKMTAHLLPHEAELVQSFPISRMGSAEDAAGTAIYLSSRAAAWVTGHVLVLDGGLVADA
ncbi:MAG: 3-oxoacyl-ACP reductase [Haliea sp.]|jgi:NAD(P)-dependent dehydrogenase (short-subunit alcohol dehydrogenase family)|uniref:SDR family NAD(P)-dependent oxidoreductase n=1 Tax=Haliea sp. TaxID=1932666 RepID=UPI000C4A4206|nr:SDR family NAD(P)-dependent oxidoreductase [Haliea sp.]MBM70153.1 3-oxoacyl-ACP reductase [Haliea sp.]|tara:strand:- start:42763 stop:43530 length:768 start_codon:yes stop_codon:yes gene_type:complete